MGGSGMLNELLLQMDPPPQELKLIGRILRTLGLRKRRAELPPVLTMAATNLPDVLDPALLRPGRFDRKIVVDRPSAEGRREILEYYLAKVKHVPDLPVEYMVYDTIGYTPVAIRYVINEAVIHAHFDGRTAMNYADFTAARETHEMGLKQPILGISYEERRRLAFHEAGHAVAGFILRPKSRTVKVSIVRHGTALGFAAYKPKEETHTETREEILADIQVSLASRAAEEQFLSIQMTGVTNDLQQATMRATQMVNAYGMVGTLYSTLTFGQFTPDAVTRRKVERILEWCFATVGDLLLANRDAVVAVAEALLVHDELNEEQLREIMQHYTIVIPDPRPEPAWTEDDERRALAASALYAPATPIAEQPAADGNGI
jgi:ATP-dependent Zn protease